MAVEDATIEACNLFSQLAISKTTTIEEVVSKNYGSWRALLTLMKEIRQDDTSKFSKLDLERIANLSVGFHQWGTRQLKERSPMFSDEFKRFVSNRLIVESLMEDLMGSARSKGGDENNDENVDDGFGGEQSKTKTSGGAETKASLSPSVRKKQLKKAVMIEIPVDGECEIEEEEEEEEEEAFKVSGKVMNTPPQQQQQQQQQQRQQQRVAEPHHTRFDSSPESEGGIFEEEEAAEEEEEEKKKKKKKIF
jgi:FtsZ-interacting cell division protein ZipA